MVQQALRPVYFVESLGEQAVVPEGGVLNIGGVVGPTFYVGDKALVFKDGTATDGTQVSFPRPDIQTIYDNGPSPALIAFSSGKDLIFSATNGNRFVFDADTGNITIDGTINGGGTGVGTGDVRGFEHVQISESDTWTITHNRNSRRVQVSLWDSEDALFFSDDVEIVDANTVKVTFNTSCTGRAILMLF